MSHTAEICRLKLENRDLSGAEIARRVGVSRQFVNMELRKARLPTVRVSGPGKRCQCGKRIEHPASHCWDCYKALRHKEAYMILPCGCGCGETFERRRPAILRAASQGQRKFFTNHSHATAYYWRTK